MQSEEAELRALMIAALDGDARAYRTLLEHMRRRLERFFAGRLGRGSAEVEDLVQDTLIAIHTRRDTYDRGQPFTAWAYAIARYKLIDHFRRVGRRGSVSLEAAGDLFVQDESEAVHARHDVRKALGLLADRPRRLLAGVKIEELSNAEAAERSGMSEGAVRVAVHRSLKALTSYFRGLGDKHEQ